MNIQIGVDIATAISVAAAAFSIIRANKNARKRQQKLSEKETLSRFTDLLEDELVNINISFGKFIELYNYSKNNQTDGQLVEQVGPVLERLKFLYFNLLIKQHSFEVLATDEAIKELSDLLATIKDCITTDWESELNELNKLNKLTETWEKIQASYRKILTLIHNM